MKRIYFRITLTLLLLFSTIFTFQAQNSGLYDGYVITETNNGGNFYNQLVNSGGFNGANLGSFSCTNSLVLKGGQNKVWKCYADNDITGGDLHYRVYSTSGTAPSFSSINLGYLSDAHNTACGGNGTNQVWETNNANVNILSGLSPGTYYLEIYNTANYTWFGNPGIHYLSNGGANYKATFTVIGDNTPPNAICNNITVQLDSNGSYTLTQAEINAIGAGSSDVCGAVTFSVNDNSFDCSDLSVAAPVITDLFFSEYVEGSGNNKYIEIYNGTGSPVNLSNYQLRVYSNGSTSPTSNTLSGTLANGATVVYKNSSATIYGGTATSLSSVTWNGNDAIALWKISTSANVDVFGRIGNDPGTAWTGAGGYSTLDKTLRRKSSVTQGITTSPTGTGPTAFTTLTTQWDVFNIDNVANLGSHTVATGSSGALVTLTVMDQAGNSSNCTATVTVVDNILPTISCPTNATVSTTQGFCYATGILPDYISVPVINPDFEILYKAGSTTITSPIFPNGGGTYSNSPNNIPGPTVTFSDGSTGNLFDMPGWTWNTDMGVTNFNSAFNNDRDMIMWMNGASFGGGTSEKTISQTLGTNLEQNVTYTLTADFGWRNDNSLPSPPVLRLYAGATLLTPIASHSPSLVQGDFVTHSRTYLINNNSISGPLRIELGMAANVNGQQLNMDHITLAKTSIITSDACSGVTITATFNGLAINELTQFPLGNNTVVYTATDNSGNTASCSQTIIVEDNQAPNAICNNIIVQLDSSGSYTLSQADIDAISAGSSDDCGAVTLSVDTTTFNCSNVSSGDNTPSVWINEIHYDNTGADVGEFVEVAGTAGFDLTGYSIVLYNGSGGVTYDSDNLSGSIDDEGSGYGAIHLTYPANGLQNGAPDGVALVDNLGNVVEFLSYEGIILATNGPANGTTSTDIGVSENGTEAIGNSLQRTGDASSAWTGPLAQTPGSLNLGAGQNLSSASGVTVTLTVTDSNGNTATCDANVTVEDNIAPNAVCTNYTLQLDANGNATLDTANIDGGSTDACGIASLSASQTSFDCSHVGTNTVTLTVTDVNGNISTCDATVTVEDNVAPSVVCNDITVQLDATGNYTLTQANIDAIGLGSSDACGAVTFSVDNDSFDCSDIAVASTPSNDLFISEYIEGGGNNKCIEIYNGTGAAIDLAASGYTLERYSNGATTGTSIPLTGTLADGDVYVICNPSSTAAFLAQADETSGNINFNGDDAVALLKNGTAIDIFGKIGQDPGSEWSQGGNGTVNKTLVRNANITDGNTNDAADFPSLATEWTQFAQDDVSNLGSHSVSSGGSSPSVTLTVTDVNGNTATCTATITVQDNIAPNALCQNVTVQLDGNGNGSTTAELVNNGSTDNCGIASLELSQTDFDCSHVGQSNTVTLTVTDTSGNVSTCTATVTVEDNVAPTVVCNDITVQLDVNGNYTLTQANIDAIGNGSNDACGAVTFSVDNDSFDCSDVVASEPIIATDLFFSQYIEGSGFNKYIEIYNGTGADVNLSDYELRLYSNGASSPSTTNGLSGILANGNVVVYRNSGATIYGGASIVDSAVNWNGDDAIELYKIPTGTSVDIFGEIGSDPGSSWNVGGNTTINATLLRNDNIISGNTSNGAGFPSLGTEWSQLGIDDVSGLGSHSIDQGNSNSPTVTLTVTDVNGNTATCIATVTVEDTIEPNAMCNPITVNLDDNGNYTLSSADIDVIANGSNDACGIASFTVSPDTFTCSEIGSNTVTLTVTDTNGNTSTCATTVTVEDIVAPVVICQDITVQLDASGAASIVASDLDGGSFDTCSAVSLAISQNSFDCGDVNATVSINDLFFSEYVEGGANNKYIEIYNGTGANIDLSDYELRLYSNGNTSPNTTNTLSGILADGAVKVYQNSGATIYGGSATNATAVNWNGDDAIELYKISTGTSIDIFGAIGEDPGSEWNVSGNETADHTLRRNVTITNGNTNNIVGFPSLGTEWTEYAQNDVSDLGNHTVEAFGVEVILTATDAYGNSSSCTSIVRVEDNVAPVALCQAVTVQLDENGIGSITAEDVDNGSNDACGAVSLELSQLDFDCSNLGTNTVTLTVTDDNGNSSTCTAIVTVEDNIAPIVDCLSLQVQLDAFGNGAITLNDINGNSTDNCGIANIALSEMNFTCDDIGGDLDELIISEYVDGTGDNNWIEIYNGTGNDVVLGEMVGSSIVSYYSLNVYYDGNSSSNPIGLLGVIAQGDVYKISHTNADEAGTSGIGTNLGVPNLNFDGNDAIALMNNGVAVDIIGVIGAIGPWANSGITTNSTTLVRKFNVLQGNINAFVANMATEWNQFPQNTYSNLGGHVIEIIDQANNIILTVTDTSGNVSTCVGEVTVVDFVAPVAACKLPEDLIFNLSSANTPGTLLITPSQVDNGSSDACGIASLELSQTEFTCANVGTNQVTLTVTDRNGNTDTCTTTITIVDDVNPAVLTHDITVQLNTNGTASITASDVDNGTSDICGIASLTVSPNNFDCSNVGPNTVTLTATDVNGNSASVTAVVTVEDNVVPSAACNAISVGLDSSGNYILTSSDINNIASGSTDACGIANLSVSPSNFNCTNIGANTVTLTVTDTNGNTTSCITTVTVNGIVPTVTISQGPLPEFCQGDVVVLTANSPEATAYQWSTGETTQSIEVSGNNTTYSVTVTSATNCTASTSFTTSFNLGALISSYTILANDDVYLHGNNLVQSGAVGATATSGLIKLHQASTIVGRGQATNFSLNQGSTIGTQVNQPANPTIPTFVFNNQSTTSSPDVTINNNQSQTLNGSVYDLITVKQNATLTFTQPNVYINDLKTFENATLVFNACTNVYLNEKFMLAKGGVINPTGQNVVFYVNDDVQIEQGSNVRARIHLNGNEILAKGANATGNGNGNNAAQPTYMTGLFIANRVHGNKNVIWNADTFCDPCPTSGGAQPPVANGNFRFDSFEVISWPNPSDTEFNIKLKTENLSDKAVIKVFDMNNRLVFSSEFGPTETYKFGKKLQSGVYLVKITQGKNSATERLVKY